jgi:hypothetical protein
VPMCIEFAAMNPEEAMMDHVGSVAGELRHYHQPHMLYSQLPRRSIVTRGKPSWIFFSPIHHTNLPRAFAITLPPTLICNSTPAPSRHALRCSSQHTSRRLRRRRQQQQQQQQRRRRRCCPAGPSTRHPPATHTTTTPRRASQHMSAPQRRQRQRQQHQQHPHRRRRLPRRR